MNSDEVVIEFVNFKNLEFNLESQSKSRYYIAFIISKGFEDNVSLVILDEDADEIDTLISDFTKSIIQNVTQYSDIFFRTGKKLRKIIFNKIKPFLKNKIKLLIAPDGEIALLPFFILPNEQNNYLINEGYEISYIGTSRDLMRFNNVNTESKTSIIISDPDFEYNIPTTNKNKLQKLNKNSFRNLKNFNRLKNSQEEAAFVASELNDVKIISRKEVIKNTIINIKSPFIMHVISHGFFLSNQIKLDPLDDLNYFESEFSDFENPMLFSGIALAGINSFLSKNNPSQESIGEGLLTAEDVTRLDLQGTELVILSACQTAIGKIHIGEGVMGFRRAFSLAGAQTIVMSLWKVDDKITKELMTYFYKFLRKNPRQIALKKAQMRIKLVYPNPFFWGAFICHGKIDQIDFEK